MANIKVGDKVQITNGVFTGSVSFVRAILHGRGTSGSDLYLVSVPYNNTFSSSVWDACYEEDEFYKIEG